VDGLANSVGANYKLGEGAISRSILQAAGADIQHELDSVKPRGAPRAGDVVVTRGHRLRASLVFHGVLKKWDNGQDDAEAASSYTVLTLLQFFLFVSVGSGVLWGYTRVYGVYQPPGFF